MGADSIRTFGRCHILSGSGSSRQSRRYSRINISGSARDEAGVEPVFRGFPAPTCQAMVTLVSVRACRRSRPRRVSVWKRLLDGSKRHMDIAMRAVVAHRLKELQQLDPDAIKALPAQIKETEPSLGKVEIIQHHEVVKTGEHYVVIQALRQRWLGLFRAIEVDGFVMTLAGTRRPLTEQEKWPFT